MNGIGAEDVLDDGATGAAAFLWAIAAVIAAAAFGGRANGAFAPGLELGLEGGFVITGITYITS